MASDGPASNSFLRLLRWRGFLGCFAIGLAALAAGCGDDAGRVKYANSFESKSLPQGDLVRGESGGPASPGAQSAAQSPADAARPTPAESGRKIIYNGRIDLKVDSLTSTQQAIFRLIEEYNAFLADSEQSSLAQVQPHATWKVRVPIGRFHGLVAAVAKLGEVTQNRVSSQDVTEEFFDVEARIRNKQEEEKRLLKILADATGRLKEILEIERELSRVREEVERMQGRLRLLASQSELSTLTIEAVEWKDYTPPIAPTFVTTMGRTFFGSIESLIDAGKVAILVFLAVLPWIPVIALSWLFVRFVIRWSGVPTQVQGRPTSST